MSKTVKQQKFFVESWLDDPIFKDWLVKDKENTKARCRVCHKVIELSSSGRSALTDHAKGKKHSEALSKVQNFFKLANSSNSTKSCSLDSPTVSLSASSSVSSQPRQESIELYVESTSTARAEIVWTLKSVLSGFSTRASDDMSQTLAAMYPEIEELKSFQMSRTKAMYVVNHGLAPYFKSLLKNDLLKTDFLVYSFDESLNDATQTTEMDLHVRFWDSAENKVKVRYYDSTFLGHATHTDILDHFKSITDTIPSEKLYQISMDGPNVNLKFYKEFSALYKENNFHSLVNIGTCSLHTVHGSFRSGVAATGWGIKKVLKGAYYVLHNSPARREDYESQSGSSKYPFNFIVTR